MTEASRVPQELTIDMENRLMPDLNQAFGL